MSDLPALRGSGPSSHWPPPDFCPSLLLSLVFSPLAASSCHPGPPPPPGPPAAALETAPRLPGEVSASHARELRHRREGWGATGVKGLTGAPRRSRGARRGAGIPSPLHFSRVPRRIVSDTRPHMCHRTRNPSVSDGSNEVTANFFGPGDVSKFGSQLMRPMARSASRPLSALPRLKLEIESPRRWVRRSS